MRWLEATTALQGRILELSLTGAVIMGGKWFLCVTETGDWIGHEKNSVNLNLC